MTYGHLPDDLARGGHDEPSVQFTSGPARVVTDDPGPEPMPLLGFVVPPTVVEQLVEHFDRRFEEALATAHDAIGPLLWEGDQA